MDNGICYVCGCYHNKFMFQRFIFPDFHTIVSLCHTCSIIIKSVSIDNNRTVVILHTEPILNFYITEFSRHKNDGDLINKLVKKILGTWDNLSQPERLYVLAVISA